MAAARHNRPTIIVYGGTIQAEAGYELHPVGAFAIGKISDEERFDVVRHACPGAGACGGMYTANTMSSALEVRMTADNRDFLHRYPHDINRHLESLSHTRQAHLHHTHVNRSVIATLFYFSPFIAEKKQECFKAAKYLKRLLELDLKPSTNRDILTRNSFLNAIVVITVLGGSTNAVREEQPGLQSMAHGAYLQVLHLLAMARAADVELSIDDFQRIGDKTPYLADLK
ncbi:hypothetical protein DXG03_001396 [Asterophora parasitica]|uniref:Dihydroxy-acid/6-phosphogluconate dehydratase N-terminal domain-containing protein n=1 Tax=Asterophora parasitica TaxID=117018 RepID=A0A9P7KGN7_9AGAR|nr:hypothetical protein DXG03_001396 [Asterophora parasitica]